MNDAHAAPVATGTPERHSPLQAVLPHILKTFRREPALALTVAYLLVALAGIYYDFAYYQKGFGIPILSLAQIGDYLVAGLQQPVAIALVAATFPLCWLMDRLNASVRRKQARRQHDLRALKEPGWWQALHLRYLDWQLGQRWGLYFAYLFIVFIYGWIFVGFYARFRVAEVRHGVATQMAIRMNGEAADLPASTGATWTYLGAVSNHVFVYDHAARQAMVLPVNAIASLRPLRVAKRPADAPLAAKP